MSEQILSPDHPAMQAIGEAVALAEQWAHVDGGHHKQWLIDQMVRALAGVDYADWVAAYEADGGEWDVGIAP